MCVPLLNGLQLLIDTIEGSQVRLRLLRRRMTVVLDLDHTLVHASTDVEERSVRRYKWFAPDDTHVISIKHPRPASSPAEDDDEEQPGFLLEPIVLSVRPGTRALLSWLSSMHETVDVMVCSAGCRAYVDAVVDLLDPGRSVIRHTVSRESLHGLLPFTTVFPTAITPAASVTSCVKDLRRLGVHLHTASAVVLDDRPDVEHQPPHCHLLLCASFSLFVMLGSPS